RCGDDPGQREQPALNCNGCGKLRLMRPPIRAYPLFWPTLLSTTLCSRFLGPAISPAFLTCPTRIVTMSFARAISRNSYKALYLRVAFDDTPRPWTESMAMTSIPEYSSPAGKT